MRGVLERKRGPPRSSSRGTLATISFASLSVLLSLPYLSLTSSRACRARELLLRGAPFVSQGIRKEAKKQAEAYARERVEELRTNVARESGRVAMDKVFFFFFNLPLIVTMALPVVLMAPAVELGSSLLSPQRRRSSTALHSLRVALTFCRLWWKSAAVSGARQQRSSPTLRCESR